MSQINLNLTALLLAEKEEKRQLYNRFKTLERERNDLAGMLAEAQVDKQRVKQLTTERNDLDKMVAKLLDENAALLKDNAALRMPQFKLPGFFKG